MQSLLCIALVACSSQSNPSSSPSTLPDRIEKPDTTIDNVPPKPKRLVARGCPAVRFKGGIGTTQLTLCEDLGWHVGICEADVSGVTKGMDRCDAVKLEDKRRLEIEAECMSWELAPEQVVERSNTALRCYYKKIPSGYTSRGCGNVAPCLREAGFAWAAREDWSELKESL